MENPMNLFRSHKVASFAWIGVAIIAALLVGVPALYAADDKKDKPAAAAPAPKAATQPAARPAPPQHQDRPANTNRSQQTPQTSPAHINNSNASHPTNTNPGRPIYPNNTARPSNPNTPSNANTGKPTNTYNPSNANSGKPSNTYNPSNTNTGRPAYTNSGNPSNANTARPSNTYSPRNGVQNGQVTRHPNGSVASYRGANNNEAHFRRDGSVREVRANNMTIVHGPAGTRRIESVRADRTRIVTNRAGHGFVERPYRAGGRDYYQRTYYSHNVAYTRVYRSYYYAGGYYPGYVPVRFYSQVFYGWAYSPWAAPVYYRWGWAGSPWYGYYGGYFTPYPVYSSPSLWLTDYLMAATLQDAYQERMDAAADAQGGAGYSNSYSGQTGLTPDVKQAIADEVHRQIQQENLDRQAVSQNSGADAAPAAGLPILSGNPPHVFVVSSNLDVTAGGQECIITQGDVLQMNDNPPPDALSADVQVMASKGQDCPRGSLASVSLQDLQEMQNHMRATLDQGLGELQAHPGQGGLPKPPASALRDTVTAPYAASAPPVDTNAATELRQQAQEASQAEQGVLAEASSGQDPQAGGPPPAGSTGTPTISIGQSINDVVGIMGSPKQIVDLGAKKIYVYKDMKIIFLNERVSDVQ
jgi:hypothetical protein